MSTWFDVDRHGLRELHSNLPKERLVMELIQNAWDENSSRCVVTIKQGDAKTELTVEDDNPEGFRNLSDAFTMFKSTAKRSDPTKRGRFNFGEKVVLSCAKSARITTTKGTVVFTDSGRRIMGTKSLAGSVVHVVFPKWTKREYERAIEALLRVIPPNHCRTSINGTEVASRVPAFVRKCSLPTEVLRSVGDAQMLTRTERVTSISLYPKDEESAFVFEMGLPVCEIEGIYHVDVAQKIPVSQDRTSVSGAFIRELYAEVVNALDGNASLADLGIGVLKTAFTSERVEAKTAASAFREMFGDKAVIQSHVPDPDQEAARHGYALISGKTFGAEVNEKLRAGGVETSKAKFDRRTSSECWKQVDYSSAPLLKKFVGLVEMLCRELCSDEHFTVSIAEDLGSFSAQNENKHHLVFAVKAIDYGRGPVSGHIHLILHEIAHCRGNGHDGVYDHEFERLVRGAVMLALTRPELFREYEESIPIRPSLPIDRAGIVCLCGSITNMEAILRVAAIEVAKGRIALTPIPSPDTPREILDQLHRQKIDMADEVVAVGRIGESTSAEVAYARSRGKAVRFVE